MKVIKLSFEQLMDVMQLYPSGKLELNEMIWKDGVAIPIEHQNLANERIKRSKSNPSLIQDWETPSKKSLRHKRQQPDNTLLFLQQVQNERNTHLQRFPKRT